MRISISAGSAYYDGDNWEATVDYVKAADRLGIDSVWSAEAWGMEAVTPLAYLAAVTESIGLGTGIMQISARTPALTAMTALSMAQISADRFRLGLGVSGPQVVEGWHGQPFAKPLSRLREHVEVIRMALRGERLVFEGDHIVVPRPGGEGKALRSTIRPRPDLPIYLATLGPRSLEATGELADGWLGTSFIPESADVMLDPIRKGAERAGRSLDDIDIQVSANIVISEDVEALIDKARPKMAFTLGAMGSAKTNFYNDAYSRAGWADSCDEVRRLWVAGDKAAAMAAIPEEMILAAEPIGTEQMVRQRLAAYGNAGVDCLRVSTRGASTSEQIAELERMVDLVSTSQG